MITLYHGSPFLFDHFDLSGAGEGTGIKFGFGVYLTESEASAVHYSQPRKHSLQSGGEYNFSDDKKFTKSPSADGGR